MQTNVLDQIIANRQIIMSLASQHGISQLKLYGSVLARKERPDSDINLIAYPKRLSDLQTNAIPTLQAELKQMFPLPVSIKDGRWLSLNFSPYYHVDPVDIMQLDASRHYKVTPTTRQIYCRMLAFDLSTYSDYATWSPEQPYVNTMAAHLADRIVWWFTKLLRLPDLGLLQQQSFNPQEVLDLCNQITVNPLELSEPHLSRLKAVLPSIIQYVDTYT